MTGIAVAVGVWLLGYLMLVVFAAVLIVVILHGLSPLVTRVVKLPLWAALSLVVGTMLAVATCMGVVEGTGLSNQAGKLRLALAG